MSATNKTPARVLATRHLIVIAAIVTLSIYIRGDLSSTSLTEGLGELLAVIIGGVIIGSIVTIFTSSRSAAETIKRSITASWALALLLLMTSFTLLFGNEKKIPSHARPALIAPHLDKPKPAKFNIDYLRARYPKLEGMSDMEIARMVHQELAPGTDFEEFSKELGAKP